MIIIESINTSPTPARNGMSAIEYNCRALPPVKESQKVDFCFCDYECDYQYKVFNTDKTSFLIKRFLVTDTVEIKLFKDGQEVAVLNDNTYGTLYDGFSDGTTEQQLYYGFLVDWDKVFIDFGSGFYHFEFNTNILGSQLSETSYRYWLLPYSDYNADKTVKLEWYQNGNIRRSQFDYTGLNWYQSIRLEGKFGQKESSLEIDNYVSQDYRKEQIQDKVINEYTLELEPLPSEIGEVLIEDMILGNRIEITDNNLFNYLIYRNFEVQALSVDRSEEFAGFKKKIFNIKFTDRFDDLIKTTFY